MPKREGDQLGNYREAVAKLTGADMDLEAFLRKAQEAVGRRAVAWLHQEAYEALEAWKEDLAGQLVLQKDQLAHPVLAVSEQPIASALLV